MKGILTKSIMRQEGRLFTSPAGGGKFVPPLGHLNEIGLDSQKVQSYLDYREGRITREDFINPRTEREKLMYDAVERIKVSDNQNIEIIWKFDDLFVTA